MKHGGAYRFYYGGGGQICLAKGTKCPHVVRESGYFYLFKTQEYTPGSQQTTVFRSEDPMNFDVDTGIMNIMTLPLSAPEIFQFEDTSYLAALMPDLKGIRVARMTWREEP